MPKNAYEFSGKIERMLLTACRPFPPFVIGFSIIVSGYCLCMYDLMHVFGIVLIIWERAHDCVS